MNCKTIICLGCAAVAFAAAAAVRDPPKINWGGSALKFLAENVYGVRPQFDNFKPTAEVVKTEELADLNAVKKTVKLNTMTQLGETSFEAVGYFPKKAGRSPVFLYLAFRDPHDLKNDRWPVKMILDRGCATIAFRYEDVLKDDPKVLDGITRPENGWGAISTWALAASRVADYLVTDVQVDTNRIAIVGLSRLGKTCLWAGANDRRFALVCPTCSGLFGVRMACRNLYGETIDQITAKFPHWFAPKCRTQYAGKDNELPFDQHWLMASVSPRMLAIGSADQDWWACPSGEMAGWEYASEAWARQGRGNLTFHLRHGEHDITDEDWKEYLDFAKEKGWMK